MSIPAEHKGRYIYHFTHLENLENIVEKGLLSTNLKNELGIKHKNIANFDIQCRRANMSVTCGPGGFVHDYVPFYFCARVPMLLGVLNSKNVDQQFIIYLAVPISVLTRDDVVFTSASANTAIPPSFFNDPSDLSNLKWELIDSDKWGYSEDDLHAKMAEALIHRKVEISDVKYVVVWNESIRDGVESILKGVDDAPSTEFDGYIHNYGGKEHHQNHFFSKFWLSKKGKSIITGPYFLKATFDATVTNIIKKRKSPIKNPRFQNVSDAIVQIEEDFSILPELEDIVDLETANRIHWQSVCEHSKRVAKKITQQTEYNSLPKYRKNILKLVAYLHDIGKGVSQKDNKGRQKVDNDHPAGAMPMLERILSEEFQQLSEEKIRQIVMLVCYHDLIGDICGKDRDRDQIMDVIDDITDFDMLSVISKADVASLIINKKRLIIFQEIDPAQWLSRITNKLPELRKWVEDELEEAE
ncbi:DarT ssDNA thymidine ADP-ribosyltransferase family protein [Planctomycetota bacterium]